jgi:hypothetical protein
MPRTILHLDLDAFFCAVEENHNPALKGKAFAVGGRPEERGVVASCSYAARRMGVRSAMPMSRAIRLCPGLIIVSSRHRSYREVSERVMGILHDQTPLVEQISIDEAFLDVSDIRAVLVAVKAAVLNLLSISAAYGIIVAVFQWGWLASVFGVGEPGPIESWVPMMMFAILFGLSMGRSWCSAWARPATPTARRGWPRWSPPC